MIMISVLLTGSIKALIFLFDGTWSSNKTNLQDEVNCKGQRDNIGFTP